MSSNLDIYNAVRTVPQEAQKSIGGGRLKGMTDINPMWRIKTLTEQFGLCGVGWKTAITRQWLETGADGQIAAFMEIALHIKQNGEWSDAIPGVGGSMFVASEKAGLYTDDEAFKKAYTDAISVACKALGFGADVYWSKDSTKYSPPPAPPPNPGIPCPRCKALVMPANKGGVVHMPAEIIEKCGGMCVACWKKEQAAKDNGNG